MAKISPTKASMKVPHTTTGVVTKSSLASGSHSAVFPQNVDGGHPFGHMSPRPGADMTGHRPAKPTK